MTTAGEALIPFSAYVQSSGTCTAIPRHSITPRGFYQLPEEIQLYILAVCSTSTLFHLMHVSAKLRIEASKLFWAKEDAYFSVEAHWLLHGAYSGHSYWDMAFLAQVQNVEVEYTPTTSKSICPQQEDGTISIQQNLITAFWATLKGRIPNVKKVILNQNEENIGFGDETKYLPLAIQLLLQACPQDIEVSVLFLEKKQEAALDEAVTTDWRTATWQRCLYQQTRAGVWDKRKSDRLRQTIMMPPKQFKGPVGRFIEFRYQCYWNIPLQRFGLWPLMVEALDRHHFDMGRNESFCCQLAGCTAYFTRAGEWTVHAAEVHYQEWRRLMEILPNDSVGADLRERNRALDRKTTEVQENFKEMKEAWKIGDEATRDEIQRSWMEQLASDAAWETREKGEKSKLWLGYMEDLYSDH
jgi:hypothetical protein